MSDVTSEFDFHLNLLCFTAAEFGGEGKVPSDDDFLKFFCNTRSHLDRRVLLQRYYSIVETYDHKLALLPSDEMLMRSIFLPLRGAISCYMLGNYLGTIAICGSACEMLAVFQRTMEWFSQERSQRPLKSDIEKFVTQESRASQSCRLRLLSKSGIANEEALQNFELVREKRNAYLHRLSHDHEHIADDARRCWKATSTIAALVMGFDFSDGKLIVDARTLGLLRAMRDADEVSAG